MRPYVPSVMRRTLGGFLLGIVGILVARPAAAQPDTQGATDAQPPPASAASAGPADAQQCFPSCRAGYLCHQGRCISACNPPCAGDQTCRAGECVAKPGSAGASATPAKAGPPPDAGWARAGGVVALAGGAATLGLAIGAAVNNDDSGTAIPLGAAATVVFAASMPISAAGAGSARDNPGVRGATGARIAGWIGYGVTVLDAMTLLGLGLADVNVNSGLILSVGALGAATSGAFAADAFISASEADHLASTTAPAQQALRLAPVAGVLPPVEGRKPAAYLGIGGVFF